MLAALERLVRHAVYALRDRFLVRPLVIALALGGLGILLPFAEERFPALDAWIERLPVLAPRDPVAAAGVLASIIGAMMTVVSIVLSVLLVALTLASMQFSPRILAAFVEDRVSQRTIGIFLGAFLFCLFAYPTARTTPPTTPAAATLGAMLLAIACIVSLVAFVHHIARSINVNFITDRIAQETEGVIDSVMPGPRGAHVGGTQAPPSFDGGSLLRATRSGYIRFVDAARLRSLAKSTGVALRVERRVGDFVAEGVPLVRLSRVRELAVAERDAILAAVDLGPMRTMEQDIEFGLLQLVDIALKAISPAVNDPSTAINCIDQLTRLLVRVASREPACTMHFDPPGVPRVVLPPASFARLLDVAFDQIVHYGKSDAAVSLRVQRALADIAAATSDPEVHALVLGQAKRAATAAAETLPPEEAVLVKERLATVERAAVS
jgi:uncharacterized membrane protein